eukprot:c28100_g1_i1 orf=208-2133(+)
MVIPLQSLRPCTLSSLHLIPPPSFKLFLPTFVLPFHLDARLEHLAHDTGSVVTIGTFSRQYCPNTRTSCAQGFSAGLGDFMTDVSQELEQKNGNLASRWREIQGVGNWKGLLEPLDLELRKSVIRYGEFNQAAYDSVDTNAHSKYTGSCKYNKAEFFDKVGLAHGRDWGYEVSRYLYATSTEDMPEDVMLKSFSRESWSHESNWIGYVAVATDSGRQWLGRTDIVIVWRGTMRTFEWIADFNFGKTDVTPLLPPHCKENFQRDPLPMVEKGWLILYTSKDPNSVFTQNSARDQVLNELKFLLTKYKDEDISITTVGHGLGAALAILNAYDIAENGLNLTGDGMLGIPVTAITFGCPGVGDDAFKKRCEELPGLHVLRVENTIDLITQYPGSVFSYGKVGEEILVNSRKSPFLKDSKLPSDWHNLETHLHLVAGIHGPDMAFNLVVFRDVALINKSSAFLLDEYLIPGYWWQDKNKGMVQTDDGFWYLPDRSDEHLPTLEPLKDITFDLVRDLPFSARLSSTEPKLAETKPPFGYKRMDVILIGVAIALFGTGLKYGLELFGVDPLKAGNAVQLLVVLGLTFGWISTYIFRVSTKDMTYSKQLKDYENKVMQKRLEELPETELETLLAQVEEEKKLLQHRKN